MTIKKKSKDYFPQELSSEELGIAEKVIKRYAEARRCKLEGPISDGVISDYVLKYLTLLKKRYWVEYRVEVYGSKLDFTLCILHDRKNTNMFIGVTKKDPSDSLNRDRARVVALTRAVRKVLI